MRIPARASLGGAPLSAVSLGVVSLLEALFVSSCTASTEPRVAVSGVTPASAYSDATVSVVIEGGPFRPVYDIDTGGGQVTTQLDDFTAFLSPTTGGSSVPPDSLTWLSSTELAAVLPAGVPAGTYDVEVRDPRGQLGGMPAGFVSLGPDETPPAVTILEPTAGTIVNAEAEVPVAFTADDGQGFLAQLHWSVSSSEIQTLSGTCPLDPNAQRTTCRFLFVVPPPPQAASLPLNVVVEAEDTAHTIGRAQATLAVGVAPVLKSFSPVEGPAAGGTLVSVIGDDFIVGTQAFVGDELLTPNGGTEVSPTLLQGTTVAHEPGTFPVTVQTGAASQAKGIFEFVGRPEVRLVSSASGPSAGCTPIAIAGKYFRDEGGADTTQIFFGTDVASAVPLCGARFVSANRIEGFTPSGAGTVSIFAVDGVGGVGQLDSAFAYQSGDAPDAAAPGAPPAACPCADGGAP
jgi:hypothetical protein